MPRLFAVLVCRTRPQVEYGFATDLDAQRRAALLRIIEKIGKCLAHCFELEVVKTLNLHPHLLVKAWLYKACIVPAPVGF